MEFVLGLIKGINPKMILGLAGVIFIGYLLYQWKYDDLNDCKADVTKWSTSYSDLNKEIKLLKMNLNATIVERDNALTDIEKLKDDIEVYKINLEVCKSAGSVYNTPEPVIIKPEETVKDGYIVF